MQAIYQLADMCRIVRFRLASIVCDVWRKHCVPERCTQRGDVDDWLYFSYVPSYVLIPVIARVNTNCWLRIRTKILRKRCIEVSTIIEIAKQKTKIEKKASFTFACFLEVYHSCAITVASLNADSFFFALSCWKFWIMGEEKRTITLFPP